MFRRSFVTCCALVAFASTGCAPHAGDKAAPTAVASVAAVSNVPATPLPLVTAPPSAVKPPAWIIELSPTHEAAQGAQIRIRFANDVVPVEALEAPDRQTALAKVEIAPAIPGHFIFVTPRMISFEAEKPVPLAARFVVTLRAGLADLKGNTLDRDIVYSFTTKAPAIYLPDNAGSPPQGTRPRISINATVPLDETSLAAHASIGGPDGKSIALVVAHDPSPSPGAMSTPETSTSFDTDLGRVYTLVPNADLPLATRYTVKIAAGIKPALGNLPTAEGASAPVRTYGKLAFEKLSLDTSGSGRRFVAGDPKLVFPNELDAKTIDAAITITPKPRSGYTQVAWDGSTGINVNASALEPETTYTLHIAATLKDRFGQTLVQPASATFATGALVPELWASDGFSIFPKTVSVALDLVTANLPKNTYRARYVKMAPEDVIATDVNFGGDLDDLLGKDAAWQSTAAPAGRDAEATSAVPLARTLDGPTGLLAYGVAASYTIPGADPVNQRFTGAVQITDVGVFAQWFPTGGFVRAHRLSTGAPIAGATVEIYESKPAPGVAHVACATGTTDATGTFVLSASRFQQCLSLAKHDDQAPTLVAIVHDHSDWAFVRTDAYGQGLGDSSYGAWSAGLPHARGNFVSDRQLYQRGETAYFTGFGFFETAGAIVRGSSPSYVVVAKSPQGKAIALGSHALDAYGSFDVHFTLASDADLGDWEIDATGTHGEAFSGSFTVAQFKAPTFRVALSVDKKIVAAGDSVTAITKSAYLFGAPLARGAEHVAVTRSQTSFTPKGYETFSYGPQYEYPEVAPSLDGDVSESDLTTAADGSTSLAVPVAKLPFATQYRIDGEVKDVSNLAVSDSATFTALPSDDLIMLRGNYLGTAHRNFDFDFADVDPSGKALAGKAVHFVLARRVYDTATQLVEGSDEQHDSVHYETAQEFDATSTDAVQHLHALPAKGGEYRLRATSGASASEATATDLFIYVAGEDAQWYRPDDTSLHVKLDKTTYEIGDLANALIASPYEDAELMYAVVRNGAMVRKTMAVHGATASIPFTITPDMLPNAVFEAVLVRRGPSLAASPDRKLAKLSREGFATIHVALASKYVTVSAKPAAANVGPGEKQTVTLHVADPSGRPVRAEITLAVANDAVLQLSGYRFPDLVQQIYADLPISTRYADNRGDVKLATVAKPEEKGFGYGGGSMAGPAGTRVRTDFRPIAFFDGSVLTDGAGNATVSFKLPDDLTTWRILALARTRDTRFGTTDATFVATKPLVTTPILPQFARPGDTLQGGVSVTDVSATKPGADAGDIDVAATLAGPLAFVSDGDASSAGASSSTGAAAKENAPETHSVQTLRKQTSRKTHFDGPTAGYRFAMLVTAQAQAKGGSRTPADASVMFRTGLGAASDAFTVSLPIVTDDVLESVVDTGTTNDNTSVPLTVDAALPNDVGGVHVTLASTLLGNTLAPLDAALANDGPPFGYESAARIAVAADRILLERRYGTTSDVPQLLKRIASERNVLRALARSDGSYAFYPNGPSDAFTTAYVAIQLVQAKSAGVDVADDLAAIHENLLTVLADPTKSDPLCKDPLCKAEARLEALETLAPMGDVRSDHLSDIYALRDKMSYYERVEMARHLVRLPEWHDRGIALRDKLLQQLYETGRYAGLLQANDFGETPIDGQSQLLGLMIESNVAGERVDRAFESLLGARGRDGTWGCACADAEAMNAVVLYADRDRVPPDFTATAQVGGGTAFAQRFEGYKITQLTNDIAMSALPRGKSAIALFKHGTGTLHYTVDFDYAIRGANAGTYQGIRIDRIVRPANGTGEPIASFGLAAPANALTIQAGNVFDIEDRITTDHPLDGLVVSDSLAAGLEAIDTRFATNSAHVFESISDWSIDYQTIERNRVVTYARAVQPGVYAFHYLVRSVTPGTFSWPSARASLALAPDEFGRTASGTLVVK